MNIKYIRERRNWPKYEINVSTISIIVVGRKPLPFFSLSCWASNLDQGDILYHLDGDTNLFICYMQSEKVLKSTVLSHTSHHVNLMVAPPVLEVGGAANVLGCFWAQVSQ